MISLKNVCKRYGENIIYENFNLDFEEKKITVVLGESGSGKTTLLNIMAGLTDYTGVVDTPFRSISMVFQKDLLVKNLTVEENLRLFCPDKNIVEGLASVNLAEAKNLYPKQLSGGMARRVAILRAILSDSPLCLMDEPVINLDLKLKFSLMELIKRNQKEKGKTLVVVTHDIKEAVFLADRIVVLAKNKAVYDFPEIKKDTENELFNILMSL